MKRLAPDLRRSGIIVDLGREDGGRYVRISWKPGAVGRREPDTA